MFEYTNEMKLDEALRKLESAMYLVRAVKTSLLKPEEQQRIWMAEIAELNNQLGNLPNHPHNLEQGLEQMRDEVLIKLRIAETWDNIHNIKKIELNLNHNSETDFDRN